jgi:hypothetical protein
MRTFEFVASGETAKRVAYTEKELTDKEYRFPIADGYGYYRVHKIYKRGDDPIVVLHKVKNHPHNWDDWGEPERLVRVSELIRQAEWEKFWAKQHR